MGFCSNSVNISHAQALQQDASAFCRARIIDCPCCLLTVRVDTIWYTVSCTKSVHFSASLVEHVALKSSNVGNARALNWSTKLVNAYLEQDWYSSRIVKSFYSPSRCAIGHFSSTIVINSDISRCSVLYTSFGPVVSFTIVVFPCTVMFLLLKFPSYTSAAVVGSMTNDCLIPIVTSNRVVVVAQWRWSRTFIR